MNNILIKAHLDDTERLIEMQSDYIVKLRWLLLRSILKGQGHAGWNEPISESFLPDRFDFDFDNDIKIIDGKEIGMKTPYIEIVNLKHKLK